MSAPIDLSARRAARRAAAKLPTLPLTPTEMLPDDVLVDLGEWRVSLSEQDIAALVMYLPEICGEIIAWRAGRKPEGMLKTLGILMPNARLFHLANGGPERAMGLLSAADHAEVHEHLPALCSELLIWRAIERGAVKPDAANSGGGDCSTSARSFQFTSRRSSKLPSQGGTRGGAKSTHGTCAPAPKTFAACADEDHGTALDQLDRAQLLAIAILVGITVLVSAYAGVFP
ncbi:hypothetical protein [Shimia aestuarii]|uniref:hypothetical protein n=1 Tax=Shimia aestuarii TaxID=254406 RepID=UPI001FB20258|nr:hypothetical protein [Shimia aestuarii]